MTGFIIILAAVALFPLFVMLSTALFLAPWKDDLRALSPLLLIAGGLIIIALLSAVAGCVSTRKAQPEPEKVRYDVVCSSSEREYRFESESCYAYKGSFYFDQGLGQGMCFCVVKGAL